MIQRTKSIDNAGGGKYHTCLSYQSVIKSNWPSCTTWLESLEWHYAVLTHFFPALSPRSEVGCYFNSESSHMPGPTWTDDVLEPAQHLSHLQQDRFHTHRPGTPDSAAHFSGANSITQLLEWPEEEQLSWDFRRAKKLGSFLMSRLSRSRSFSSQA